MMKIEIMFAEWLAKNHYRMCDETKDCCFWENEYFEKTSIELYKDFCLENEIEVYEFG